MVIDTPSATSPRPLVCLSCSLSPCTCSLSNSSSLLPLSSLSSFAPTTSSSSSSTAVSMDVEPALAVPPARVSDAPLRVNKHLDFHYRSTTPPPCGLTTSQRRRAWVRSAGTHAVAFRSSAMWLAQDAAHWHRLRLSLATADDGSSKVLPMQTAPSAVLTRALLRVVTASNDAAQTTRQASSDDSRLSTRRVRPGGRSKLQSESLLRSAPPTFPFVPLPSKPATRFNIDAWRSGVTGWYRDPESLLAMIRDGVDIGFAGQRVSGKHAVRPNHPSTDDPKAAAAIDSEIRDELLAGRMAGPFSAPPPQFAYSTTSPLAAVPKPDGSMRIIDDLTFGGDESVNAHIPDEAANVRYHRFDEAIQLVQKAGRGCLLGKIDWQSAFRQIAVRLVDLPLLGLHWRGKYFYRLVLPFGLRSSPKLFTIFATAFMGILRRRGVRYGMFYLDDFLVVGLPGTDECQKAMELMDKVAAELGVILHPVKRDGPATCIIFLGIGIDSVNMRVFLPEKKKLKAKLLCAEVVDSGRASLRKLQSLVGVLQHASQVVQPGRLMTRRLLEVMRHHDVRSPHRPIPLPADALDDLRWWRDHLDVWDGKSIIPQRWDWDDSRISLIQTDASTSDGAGGVLRQRSAASSSSSSSSSSSDSMSSALWFHYKWPDSMKSWPIAALEMAAIAIALATWAPCLSGERIRIHTDSMDAVHALSRQASSSALNMRILRGIHAIAAQYDFHIHVTHIRGAHNVSADAASRLSSQDRQKLEQLGLHPSRRLTHPIIPDWLRSLQTPVNC